METAEGNKLIAEFMGTSKCTDPNHAIDPCFFIQGKYITINLAKYHTSWDWLMPVVEKIEKFCAYEGGTGITVLSIAMLTSGKWRCHINYRSRYNGIQSEHKSIDIIKPELMQAVWIAVTQFIQWYNTTKEK